MTQGLKIWLMIIIVLNTLSVIGLLVTGFIISALLSAAIVIGAVLILRMKKLGFYIICAAAVGACISNLSVGYNVVISIISMIVAPLIIYLLMKKNWEAFQ